MLNSLIMLEQKFLVTCFVLVSVYAATKDVGSKSTTQKAPELETRFFGLENIFGQIFQGPKPTGGFGEQYPHTPEYHNQHNPQAQFNNWQNIQTPNQAQSNFDQYFQSTPYPQVFNSQNNFGPGGNQNLSPQQFPNPGSFNQQSNLGYPSQSMTQGNFNSGNGQNQNLNIGTLDAIPSQIQGNQPVGSWNRNPDNQFGSQNGNLEMENQNAGLQNQNGNQMGFQNQDPEEDYNPAAILGQPVPVTTSVPDSIVFKDGCDTPAQRQCVQDCQSSTEYKPVCGSNNITYFNPGRFVCARNCGIISVYAATKDVGSKSTTQKAPELETRFFGLENIFGQIFQGPKPTGGFGEQYPHTPEYHNQHNPQAQFNNWQNIQTPNQAQSNFDQYFQSTPYPQVFNSQNNFGPGGNQNLSPQQFPNPGSFNQQSNLGYPSQSMTQGNFNSGNGQNQNLNIGTLDAIPSQIQGNQPVGSWNRNPDNQFGSQNGNLEMENQNAGLQNQNGNQMGFQNQDPEEDYNPAAILGQPVPVTTSVPDSIVFKDGCDTPAQRQCVQDCQSSTEYKPVCGSNNITYFNPGRFVCARNCGINVFIRRDGKCENQI